MTSTCRQNRMKRHDRRSFVYNTLAMTLDDLRRRLEKLNRRPLADRLYFGVAQPDSAPRMSSPPTHGLESVVPGRVRLVGGAPYYAIASAISHDAPHKPHIADHLTKILNELDADAVADAQPGLAGAVSAGIGGLLFVDLETCGFAGTPVFLIGTMYHHRRDFRVEQLLARTYAEEAAILARFARLLDRYSHLVTFNGKSFDWPFLADRAAICRVALPPAGGHSDLLHAARRRFKRILPDCKLQTLEHHVCGRRRFGDIPGAEIPGAYHEFVRHGDARRLRDIIRHNYLDLTAMAEILGTLLGGSRWQH